MRKNHVTCALLFVAALASSARPAGAQGQAADCPATPGLQPLLVAGKVVLIGEMHGTEESPAFVASVVCQARAANLPVALALEIFVEEAPRLAAFLKSDGTAADRTALLNSKFWQDEYQDGRRSAAMLTLLDRLRVMRPSEGALEMTPIDPGSTAGAATRDRGMADAIAKLAAANPRALVIALTGNYHTRTVRQRDFDTMGTLLVGMRPPLTVTALDVAYDGGTAWVCTSAVASECGSRPMGKRPTPAAPGVTLYGETRGGLDGIYNVGSLTASPPATKAQ